jgi:hypothetical protein
MSEAVILHIIFFYRIISILFCVFAMTGPLQFPLFFFNPNRIF